MLVKMVNNPAGAGNILPLALTGGLTTSAYLPGQSHRILSTDPTPNIYDRTLGIRRYELTNHLGNVRAVVGDERIYSSSTSIQPQIHSLNNYYAGGSLMPGRNFNANNYAYGFNGKRMDNDMSGGITGATYDYGFRIYDSRIVRFLSVDPLTKEYPWNSTYAFAENDVIRAIDLEGAEKCINFNTRINADNGKSTLSNTSVYSGSNAKALASGIKYKFDDNGTYNVTREWNNANRWQYLISRVPDPKPQVEKPSFSQQVNNFEASLYGNSPYWNDPLDGVDGAPITSGEAGIQVAVQANVLRFSAGAKLKDSDGNNVKGLTELNHYGLKIHRIIKR